MAGATEHFVTLFDSTFLPLGMALHDSLKRHAEPFHLWVICIDELVEQQLEKLSLPNVTSIPLREVETTDLLAVKPSRSRGEYCWTLTPFSASAVFQRAKEVERVTYVDADLLFFDDPRVLLAELDGSGKDVLITEHAYAPEYDQSATSGRFCVQFLTFKRSSASAQILEWWQQQCLAWCYARFEEGKFGDQKYLERWPDLFGPSVHIVRQVDKTLAPWNVRYFEKARGNLHPVFFHFHELKLLSPSKVRLYRGYRIGERGESYYDQYAEVLRRNIEVLKRHGIEVPYWKHKERWAALRHLKRKVTGTTRIAAL